MYWHNGKGGGCPFLGGSFVFARYVFYSITIAM